MCWVRVLVLVLLPLCGAGGLGGQVVHDPGDARDLLDLIHHLQHHLNKKGRYAIQND